MWSPIDSRVYYVTEDAIEALDDVCPQDVLSQATRLGAAHRDDALLADMRDTTIEEVGAAPLLLRIKDSSGLYPMRQQVFDVGQMLQGQHACAEAMIRAVLQTMPAAQGLFDLERDARSASAVQPEPPAQGPTRER